MTQEEQEARRREMEAEIAANEAADREYKRKLIRNLVVGAVVIVVLVVGYLVLKPESEPDVYYKNGDIDYVAQADKLRRSGQFKEVNAFRGGYAIVSDGKKWGIVDVNGTVVCPIKYDAVESNYSEHYPDMALVKVGDKYGLVDKNGKEVVKPIYDSIGSISGGTMEVKQGEETFYIDAQGNKVDM